MKKILFFVESLYCGGAERSLLSLLNNLDYTGYEVHLMVAKKDGEFEKFVPQHLSIESISPKISFYSRLKFKIARILNRNKKYHNAQLLWQSAKKDIPFVQEHYDIAISWGQGFATYFVAERVTATKKFAWVNIDYKKAGYNWERDLPIYQKFYKVVGVSEFVKKCMQEFLDNEQVVAIRNIIDSDDILKRAIDEPSLIFDENKCNIVSVGRLSKQKGFELTLAAAKILIEKGYPIRWYIIGEGSERTFLEDLITKYKLEKNLFLLGFRENPYPYIKACDIYVQTSWFEGLGRTIIEASILNKPIVTTNFPTASSILEHEKTGLIVSMVPDSISLAIERIIISKGFKEQLIDNLEKQQDNEKGKTLKAVSDLFNS